MTTILRFLSNSKKLLVLTIAACLLNAISADAQYFGRNKPGYRTFNFDVLQTPHFEIYHYLKNDSMLNTLSQWAETWYKIHQRLFRDTFELKNPIVFYNNHADFQQTNTVSGEVGIGTGGVTEGLKNRVILPIAPSLSQTHHTLGHELVHAFQYHLFLKRDSFKNMSINNVPLWMIEGMAEYLSLGSVDPNTSMWMRDALLNNDFPTLRKLSTDSRYFPYRYGQAFWAMVGKTWGDTVIVPLLVRTAQLGFDKAAESILGYNEKTLSGMWKSAMEIHYNQYLKKPADSLTGKRLVSEKNGGRMNVSPSVSPDGKYVAFFSERNLFSLDLFLADASTGKIVKKMSSVVKNSNIDDFEFIESSGTWSPDSRKFAFVIFSKGANRLAVLDVKKRKIIDELVIPGIPAFQNPAWSPDGKKIVLSGMVQGISDLYLYDLETKKVDKLTDDFTANLHPAWSPDGKSIVFAQERINNESNEKHFSFIISILDLATGNIRRLDVFNDSFNLNPKFSPDGTEIYFLSDADGFRNLYRFDLNSGRVFRLTDYMTGISGITDYSPAMSISSDGKIVYNYYIKNGYQIVAANQNEFKAEEFNIQYSNLEPATLPPVKHITLNVVDTTLFNMNKVARVTKLPVDSMKEVPYKPKFKLDYISNNASIGVSTGMYRNNLGGSINMIFSDMVGNNQLFSTLALNGEIYDFGGQVAYINQKGKIKWGSAISHIPYRAGSMYLTYDSLTIDTNRVIVNNLVLDYLRMFEDNISLFAAMPLSQTKRFEATMSSSWYYYRIDRYNNYYSLDGYEIGGSRQKLPAPKGSNYQQIALAYVEDNSYFGMTSPMQGHRARYQLERYFGSANIFTALLDYRKYIYVKPFTFALRTYNFGMFGKDAESGVIPPLYIGYPWLIRGYEDLSFNGDNSLNSNTFNPSRLTGSKVSVANAEIRLPLSGPERLAIFKSKYFLADLNLFVDAGLAWNKNNKIGWDRGSGTNIETLNPTNTVEDINRFPLFSTGVSLRVNVLGYLVLEPYYAFPMQNGGFRNGHFGLNFVPGW
jgi:Tol biopolymer transport system component